MRAKSARTGFLQIAECDSALATDQNNKRRSRGLNPDCWTVAWTSRHYQLRWVLRHFSDKTTRPSGFDASEIGLGLRTGWPPLLRRLSSMIGGLFPGATVVLACALSP